MANGPMKSQPILDRLRRLEPWLVRWADLRPAGLGRDRSAATADAFAIR